jgi:exopolysaccharide biosynthesis WecB/TagA/CpsF family protein
MASEPPDGPGAGRRTLLGAPLDPVSLEAALRVAADAIAGGEPRTCTTVSAAVTAWQRRDAGLRDLLWRCDLVTADGQWVVWAAWLLGRPVPERVTAMDLTEGLLAAASAHGHRVFVLGASEPVLARASEVVARRYPGARIAGLQHGAFAAHEEADVVRRIAGAHPDLLLVAMPTPAKERLLARPHGAAFAAGVGDSAAVLAGARRRAPPWLERIGLDSLLRLAEDPRRLAPVMRANATFGALVLAELARALRGRERRRAPLDRSSAAPPAAPRRRRTDAP